MHPSLITPLPNTPPTLQTLQLRCTS